jgi:hypothetical protein
VRFLKSRTTYICRNQCDEFWGNFVHSYYAYCRVLLWCGLLKVRACVFRAPPPPPQPLPPQTLHRASLSYVSTFQLHICPSWLIRFQTHHVLFMLQTELIEAWISISAYETSRNCWPERFQWRTVTHILRRKSYTTIGGNHKNWCLHIEWVPLMCYSRAAAFCRGCWAVLYNTHPQIY